MGQKSGQTETVKQIDPREVRVRLAGQQAELKALRERLGQNQEENRADSDDSAPIRQAPGQPPIPRR